MMNRLFSFFVIFIFPYVVLGSNINNNSHVLILAITKAEKQFIKEAAQFAIEKNLTPITMNELNALLEAERIKDLTGCSDVMCISEIIGSFGIHYVIKIKPNEKANRAMISIHDIHNNGKITSEQVVSKESAIEILTESINKWDNGKAHALLVLRKIPCNFSWLELFKTIGESCSVDGSYSWKYHYYNYTIETDDNRITSIRDNASGKYVMLCRNQYD